MLVQRVAPRAASLRVAEGVELEDRAADPELFQQLVGKGEQFDIGLRLARADDLGVELVELAEAALLRPLIAKGRAGGGELERGILLPAFAQIGAADAGGEFRAEGDRLSAAILEGVHFL